MCPLVCCATMTTTLYLSHNNRFFRLTICMLIHDCLENDLEKWQQQQQKIRPAEPLESVNGPKTAIARKRQLYASACLLRSHSLLCVYASCVCIYWSILTESAFRSVLFLLPNCSVEQNCCRRANIKSRQPHQSQVFCLPGKSSQHCHCLWSRKLFLFRGREFAFYHRNARLWRY